MIRTIRCMAAALAAFLFVACGEGGSPTENAPPEVVVYTALDRQFSEPILNEFEGLTGIRVKPVYDTEAVKTVGLVNRLIAERDRPAADVFWNNEIVRSIQLKREGLTQEVRPDAGADIPPSFRDPEGHWTGFAARARVILVNTDLLPDPAARPRKVSDLADPKRRGRAGFAKPLFGTTSTHAAVLAAEGGLAPSMEFWRAAMSNAVMLAGNAQARDAVADGELAWCVTDTDDAHGALLDGKPVEIVYPEDEAGVLLIPNTVVLIQGCPHPEAGRALIEFLASREVESRLAASRSAQIPVREGVPGPDQLPPLDGQRVMRVDWEAVADALAGSSAALVELVGER